MGDEVERRDSLQSSKKCQRLQIENGAGAQHAGFDGRCGEQDAAETCGVVVGSFQERGPDDQHAARTGRTPGWILPVEVWTW